MKTKKIKTETEELKLTETEMTLLYMFRSMNSGFRYYIKDMIEFYWRLEQKNKEKKRKREISK